MAANAPAQAAIFVFAITAEIASTSSFEPKASWEPPLKPNQPNHKMNVPKVAKGKLEPGIGLMVPSELNFPFRAPNNNTPASPAHPPTE